MAGQAPLIPTFRGHISSTMDALILFEACLHGRLNHVPRRPHDRERQELITSGNIFIYEEHASGIKRWTDGVSWSPSRILGNFLIYRELEKPFPPGEKKRALKKKKVSQGINKADSRPSSTTTTLSAAVMDPANMAKDPERSLVGSLVDSYPFKNHGLVKKTISITFQGVPHHLVSYYNIDDVLKGTLLTPSEYPGFHDIQPRPELVMSQNFRNPLDEVTTYSQDDRGFLTPAAPAFYSLATPVQDFSPHQAVISQSMPVSSISVGQPMPAYSTGLEYDLFQVQPPQQQHHHHHHHQFQQQQQHHHPHHPQQHQQHQLHQQQPRQTPDEQQPPQNQYHHQTPRQQPQPHAGAFMPAATTWGYEASPQETFFFS